MSTLRKALAAVVLVATGSMGGAALASHSFPDVPNGSTFHEEIDEIAVAGCVDGFNDGTYRPRKNATRGQLARFISRCGGRAVYDRTPTAVVSTDSGENVEVLGAPLRASASGLVVAIATVNAEATAGTSARVAATVTDGDESSFFADDVLASAGSQSIASLAMTRVFPIARGETKTFTIEAEFTGTGPVQFLGELSLVFVPFPGRPVT